MIYNYHDWLVLYYSEIPKNDREKDRDEQFKRDPGERPKLTIKKETILHFTNKSWVNVKIRQSLTRTENSNENWIYILLTKPKKSWNWRNPAFPWSTILQTCQLIRFQDITSYWLLKNKWKDQHNDVFSKNREISWKRVFSGIISTRLLESHKSFSNDE